MNPFAPVLFLVLWDGDIVLRKYVSRWEAWTFYWVWFGASFLLLAPRTIDTRTMSRPQPTPSTREEGRS